MKKFLTPLVCLVLALAMAGITAADTDVEITQLVLTPIALADGPLVVEVLVYNTGDDDIELINITVLMDDDDNVNIVNETLDSDSTWWENDLDEGDLRFYTVTLSIPETYNKDAQTEDVGGDSYDVYSVVVFNKVGSGTYESEDTDEQSVRVMDSLNDQFNEPITLPFLGGDMFDDDDSDASASADDADIEISQIVITPIALADAPLIVEVIVYNTGDDDAEIQNITVKLEDDDNVVVVSEMLEESATDYPWYEKDLDEGEIRFYTVTLDIPEQYNATSGGACTGSGCEDTGGDSYDVYSVVVFNKVGSGTYESEDTDEQEVRVMDSLNDMFTDAIPLFGGDFFDDDDSDSDDSGLFGLDIGSSDDSDMFDIVDDLFDIFDIF